MLKLSQDDNWTSMSQNLTCAQLKLTRTTRCSSLPPIEVLYKLRQQRPDVFNKLEGTTLSWILILSFVTWELGFGKSLYRRRDHPGDWCVPIFTYLSNYTKIRLYRCAKSALPRSAGSGSWPRIFVRTKCASLLLIHRRRTLLDPPLLKIGIRRSGCGKNCAHS
jgi:hypothetical protein